MYHEPQAQPYLAMHATEQTKLLSYPLSPPANYFSPPLIPSPLPVLVGGEPTVLSLLEPDPAFPSVASPSKKSCQSSASDSLLLLLLAMSIGSVAAEFKEGVEGVRRKGDRGMRRPVEECEVPGRARPACSFCSGVVLALKVRQVIFNCMEVRGCYRERGWGGKRAYHPSTPTTH
jgi:hypothetical protein